MFFRSYVYRKLLIFIDLLLFMVYKIKQVPEDFKVYERNSFKFKKEGEYAYFWLKKNNWTSIKAIQEIAKRLNINVSRTNIAGNKDKYAVTRQLISIKGLNKDSFKGIKIKDMEIRYAGKRDERLSLGDLDFNEFKIIVRNLDKETDISVNKIPNYYGEQRFGGIDRPNTHLVGRLLVKKNYEGALKIYLGNKFESESKEHKELRDFVDANWGKWDIILNKFPGYLLYERQVLEYLKDHKEDFIGAFRKIHRKILLLFIHAYQSYLWNKVVSEYLSEKCEGNWKDDLFFPLEDFENKKIPIFGFLTKFKDEEIERIYNKILKKEDLVKKDFINRQINLLSSEGLDRDLAMGLSDFSFKFEHDDLNKEKKKVLINFKLRSGSYATIVVKSIFG